MMSDRMISDTDRREYRAALRAGTALTPFAAYLQSLVLQPGIAPGAHPLVQWHNDALRDGGSSGLLLDVRALSAGIGAAGGVTVQTAVDADPAKALRPYSSVLQAGAQLVELEPPAGNLTLPSLLTGHVLQWLPEGVAPPAPSEPTFGGVNSRPYRCAGWFDLSRQLIAQSPQVAMQALLRDLRAAIAHALDAAAIAGSGTLAEPAGILATAGVGSFTFGGPAEGADFTAAERTLAAAGVPGPYAVVASPACREKWRGLPQSATTTALPLWDAENRVAGLPAYVGGNLPGDRVIIGSFVEVEILVWEIEILANPYSRSLEHQVRMVTNVLADVRVRRPSGFLVSADSGAQ